MSTETALVVAESTQIETVDALKDRMVFEAARIKEMKLFVGQHMTKDVDYGTIPGTKKPTLYKPGAEIMCGIYRLSPEYDIREMDEPERIKNWSRPVKKWNDQKKRMVAVWENNAPVLETGQTRGRYEVRATCTLKHIGSGSTVGQGVGSCNSWESKYLTMDLDDTRNTILKMAQKRAYIAATLSATRLSAFFTQDMEDMPHEPAMQSEPSGFSPQAEAYAQAELDKNYKPSGESLQADAEALRIDMEAYTGSAEEAFNLMVKLAEFPDEKSKERENQKAHEKDCGSCKAGQECFEGFELRDAVPMKRPASWGKLTEKWAKRARIRFEAHVKTQRDAEAK